MLSPLYNEDYMNVEAFGILFMDFTKEEIDGYSTVKYDGSNQKRYRISSYRVRNPIF